MKSLRLIGISAAMVVATAACGGGGNGSTGPLPSIAPPPVVQGNQFTSYSIFSGTVNGESVIDVLPIGTRSSLPAAQPVSGTVIYPDASVQLADAAGNFDASQSSWALANASTIALDPSNEPLVDVAFFPASGSAPLPEELSLATYSAAVSLTPLAMSPDGSPVPELATVAMQPKSAWLEDGHNRVFTLYGRDANGAPFGLSKAQVKWSLSNAATCGAPVGKIAALPSDSSKAVYSAPASGTVVGACADQVVATVTANNTTYSGAGAAFFYDPKTNSKLAGTLVDSTGKPVANALIDLYSQSIDASQGTLLVNTDAKGKFARTVPTSRVMIPVVLAVAGKKASANSIVPSSIDPHVVGAAALAAQSWKLGPPATIAKPVAPSYPTLIREAAFYSREMREQLPIDTPNASGQFAAGTIEAILSAPVANATGTVASGDYRKYTYKWDATGKIATFTQPGPANEANVLTVTIKATQVGSTACAQGASCFSYSKKHGATLQADGAWSQQAASGKYAVTYLANRYNSTHQTAGSPLYVDLTTLTAALGASGAVTLTQTHSTPSGALLAQITTTHTPATAPSIYTYTGTVKNFPNGNKAIEVDYALNNGAVKEDGSGSFMFTDMHSPSAADIGITVNWNANATATASSSGIRAIGTAGHASFTVDKNNVVHLTLDAALGGTTSTFQL